MTSSGLLCLLLGLKPLQTSSVIAGRALRESEGQAGIMEGAALGGVHSWLITALESTLLNIRVSLIQLLNVAITKNYNM